MDGNGTVSGNDYNASGAGGGEGVNNGSTISVNVTDGWNFFGLVEDYTPQNLTEGQTPSFSATATSNITFISTYINNNSQTAYQDYIFNRTRNLLMTSHLRRGFAPWIYIAEGGNGTWDNRTGYIIA